MNFLSLHLQSLQLCRLTTSFLPSHSKPRPALRLTLQTALLLPSFSLRNIVASVVTLNSFQALSQKPWTGKCLSHHEHMKHQSYTLYLLPFLYLAFHSKAYFCVKYHYTCFSNYKSSTCSLQNTCRKCYRKELYNLAPHLAVSMRMYLSLTFNSLHFTECFCVPGSPWPSEVLTHSCTSSQWNSFSGLDSVPESLAPEHKLWNILFMHLIYIRIQII